MRFKTSAGHIESLLHHILQLGGNAVEAVKGIGLDLSPEELIARAERMREPIKGIVISEAQRRLENKLAGGADTNSLNT